MTPNSHPTVLDYQLVKGILATSYNTITHDSHSRTDRQTFVTQ